MAMVDTYMERHEQLHSLPVLGEQNEEKIPLKENREKDKQLTAVFFHLLKVQQIIWDKGPTQDHKDTLLEQRIGKGYMWVESLDVPPYNLKEAYCCNDPVEPIYYATQDTRGGKIVTKDICAVCYGPEDLVVKQEILESEFTKGREPLPICRDSFDSGMNLLFLENTTNFKTKGQEDKLNNKEKKRKTLEAAGIRQCRKL
eukprot:scaffold98739_cov71-Attheya_sp.AAC.1